MRRSIALRVAFLLPTMGAVAFGADPAQFGITPPEPKTQASPPGAHARASESDRVEAGAGTRGKPTREGKATASHPHAKRVTHVEPAPVAPPAAVPAAGRFGAGVIFGEPTGFTVKWWHGARDAIDGGIAYSLRDYLLFYLDKLWHFPEVFGRRDARELSLYAGGGVGLYFGKEFRLSARIPVGVEIRPGRVPLGIFGELVPGVRAIPSVVGEIAGGIGVRLYF